MPKKKRYFFNVIEEFIMNENAGKFCAGRIEVYDSKKGRDYACYEARFLIPKKFMIDFRKMWDFKESDEMPYIRWDYAEAKRNKKSK